VPTSLQLQHYVIEKPNVEANIGHME